MVTNQKTKQNSFYKFNFIELEERLNSAYFKAKEAQSQGDTNTYKEGLSEIYKLASDIMYGIFCVNPPEYFVKHHVDFYEEACQFGLSLVDRIDKSRFKWDHKIRNAWVPYIRLFSRWYHYDYPRWPGQIGWFMPYDPSDDIDQFLENRFEPPDQTEEDVYETKVLLSQVISQIMVYLQLFYDKSYINRVLPITLYSIQNNLDLPDDLMQFKKTFITIVKRSVNGHFETVEQIPANLDQSVSKNIMVLILLIYLSSDKNTVLPMSLTSSLDFLSIVRLSVAAGGSTIYIPTSDELDALITASSALADMMLGLDLKESRRIARESTGFSLDIRRINKHIKSLSESLKSSDFSILEKSGSKCEIPFFTNLVTLLEKVSQCQSNLIDSIDRNIGTATTDDLLRCLSEIGGSEQRLITFIERLTKLRQD